MCLLSVSDLKTIDEERIENWLCCDVGAGIMDHWPQSMINSVT